ncbi:hypothetical protein EK21DRAFT_113043 [Setomelanomma holmii]|uniref:Uncharacterized protein n=1 Tax=Setomelanomma holmii TaxID=210430 RepID=A0A9P4LM54_9PLEO|nr:hypothetical protein EK21DRAFT_113043 [Setomelanomma holmii]
MPRLAPATAASLMWHTDMKWANPLWWFRALRTFVVQFLFRKIGSRRSPNLLWLFLSLNTLLLFVAIPLNGLTIELKTASVASDTKAQIYGPNSTTFNARGPTSVSQRIYNYWQSGRPATPLSNGILYAPDGTSHVSTTYFDDQASAESNEIRFFAAPAVREVVAGRAWGIDTRISCQPVPSKQLKLLQIHDINDYSINLCMPNSDETGCNMGWYDEVTANKKASSVPFSTWFNRTGSSGLGDYNISAVVAADGWTQDFFDSGNPYTQTNNHDNLTLDHLRGNTSATEPTTAIFEIFIWQGTKHNSLLPMSLTADKSGLVDVLKRPFSNLAVEGNVNFYGISVHCAVRSAVGQATINPGHRTYASFSPSNAPPASLPKDLGDVGLTQPPQQLALDTLRDQTLDGTTAAEMSGMWKALHNAIGSAPLPPSLDTGGALRSLGPADLQLAMYRLLGDSVIAMMDEGGTEPFYGELYGLKTTQYITSGVVSWVHVIVLLSVWAALMSGGAIWLLVYAGPRWAPSLDGFEMFKFGARYTDELDDLEALSFRKCGTSLSSVPGMVGILPGTGSGRPGTNELEDRPGFIGLSECVAERKGVYTFDRKEAATTRYTVRKH